MHQVGDLCFNVRKLTNPSNSFPEIHKLFITKKGEKICNSGMYIPQKLFDKIFAALQNGTTSLINELSSDEGGTMSYNVQLLREAFKNSNQATMQNKMG